MSPILAQRLYDQLKQVFSKNFALINAQGMVVEDFSDFNGVKKFTLRETPTKERTTIELRDNDNAIALPIYIEDKLYGLIVVETSSEDIQTIQVISSMAELVVQQFMNSHKPRPNAVDLLLTRLMFRPETIDEEELEQQMATLGYRLDVQRTVIVFELSGFWDNYLHTAGEPLGEKSSLIESKKQDISQGLRSFFTKNPDNLIGYIGNDKFVVLKDLSTTDYDRFCRLLSTHFNEITDTLKNVYIKEVTIGIGSPANSPSEIIASAKEAIQVIDIGKNLATKTRVHKISGLGVLPLLVSSSPKQKRDYADKVLHELDDQELLETMENFLQENMNLTKTAERLKVHRNTVIYRLDKIQERIGRDPRSFSDAVELHLALLFKRVFN